MTADSDRSCVVVRGSGLVCKADGSPFLSPTVAGELADDHASFLETGALSGTWITPETPVPQDFAIRSLRSLFGEIPDEDFWNAGRAYQLAHWDRTHRYCGVCGTPTALCGGEIARCCPSCGHTIYPRISPAVIMAVVRDGKLLLAHNAQRKHPFYSVLAGFVEPGESLEECVVREVFEETSVCCGNVRYFTSQPWPFPDSLMIAFVADYVSGEIAVDNVEIDHAYWCPPDELPEIPPAPSVARKLIDWFAGFYGS